jgi:hypothetical protein
VRAAGARWSSCGFAPAALKIQKEMSCENEREEEENDENPA